MYWLQTGLSLVCIGENPQCRLRARTLQREGGGARPLGRRLQMIGEGVGNTWGLHERFLLGIYRAAVQDNTIFRQSDTAWKVFALTAGISYIYFCCEAIWDKLSFLVGRNLLYKGPTFLQNWDKSVQHQFHQRVTLIILIHSENPQIMQKHRQIACSRMFIVHVIAL